jgi:hypothetical protein
LTVSCVHDVAEYAVLKFARVAPVLPVMLAVVNVNDVNVYNSGGAILIYPVSKLVSEAMLVYGVGIIFPNVSMKWP